jgi:hypothetical protein
MPRSQTRPALHEGADAFVLTKRVKATEMPIGIVKVSDDSRLNRLVTP